MDFAGLPLPASIVAYLNIFAGALTPCALFAIGLGLSVKEVRLNLTPCAVLTIVKLVIMPSVVYGLSVVLGLNPLYTIAAVVCAAVPTAKTVYILAGEYKVEEPLVAATVSITTLLSVVTLLGWLYALSAYRRRPAKLVPAGAPRSAGNVCSWGRNGRDVFVLSLTASDATRTSAPWPLARQVAKSLRYPWSLANSYSWTLVLGGRFRLPLFCDAPKSKKGKIAHHPLLATQIDATDEPCSSRPSAASNLDPGKIRSPVFADLYTTDISEDVRGNIFRHVVG